MACPAARKRLQPGCRYFYHKMLKISLIKYQRRIPDFHLEKREFPGIFPTTFLIISQSSPKLHQRPKTPLWLDTFQTSQNRGILAAQQEMRILSTRPSVFSRAVIQQTSSSLTKFHIISITFCTIYFLHLLLPHSPTTSGEDRTVSCFRNTLVTLWTLNFITRILYKTFTDATM